MKVTAIQTRSRRDPKTGRTISIFKGQQYNTTSKLYKTFGHQCFDHSMNRNPDLSYDQAQYLAQMYVDGMTQNDIITSFCDKYSAFNPNGIECQLRIIAGLDSQTDDNGLKNPGRNLKNALSTIAPDRFCHSVGKLFFA